MVSGMPNTAVEQWLIDNPESLCDYIELVNRVRSGERVECVVESGSVDVGSFLAYAEYSKTGWGGLFKITEHKDDQSSVMFSMPNDFIEFCENTNVVFKAQDFLESTRNVLKIAKNAAKFKAIMLPLNTQKDVEALLALMDRVNAVSPL
jgi:hypothetical protein